MSEHKAGHGHHHILPLKTYLAVFAFLIVMTAITVFVALFDLGELNIIVAMIVAAAKATAVAAIFMHLKYDNKIYLLAFVTSLLCLGIFITLTLVDTDYRGKIDDATQHPIVQQVVLPNAGKTPEHGHEEESAGHEGAATPPDSTKHEQPAANPSDTTKPPSGH